jgi:DNA-directed RNA polymerase subunit RPC12/RpoP
MSETQATGYEVACPHCHKRFTARLIEGAAERYRGFKCPHCKLFVPAAHADEALARDRGAAS